MKDERIEKISTLEKAANRSLVAAIVSGILSLITVSFIMYIVIGAKMKTAAGSQYADLAILVYGVPAGFFALLCLVVFLLTLNSYSKTKKEAEWLSDPRNKGAINPFEKNKNSSNTPVDSPIEPADPWVNPPSEDSQN